METVKPLTWEEAKNEIAKKHVSVNWHYLEPFITEAAELYASSRVREVEEELNRVKSENKLASDLKEYVISTYEKFGDKKALVTKGYRAYTGLDLANEIRNNTSEGVDLLQSFIALTIDLLSRDKINLNGPTYQELKEENKRLQEQVTFEISVANAQTQIAKELSEEVHRLKQRLEAADGICRQYKLGDMDQVELCINHYNFLKP